MDPTSAPLPTDPQECRQRAEDTEGENGNATERLIWATLAVAGELHAINKLLRKR